jgi:hypothetical protein
MRRDASIYAGFTAPGSCGGGSQPGMFKSPEPCCGKMSLGLAVGCVTNNVGPRSAGH